MYSSCLVLTAWCPACGNSPCNDDLGTCCRAAAAFYYGKDGPIEVAYISDAYRLLSPAVGTVAAKIIFGIALLASGQNSTITGTLSGESHCSNPDIPDILQFLLGPSSSLGIHAGQVVMEGFLRIRMPPWLRRLSTRLVAVVPAAVVAGLTSSLAPAPLPVLVQPVGCCLQMCNPYMVFMVQALNAKHIACICVASGQSFGYCCPGVMGDAGAGRLLVLSQVILSLTLPFAVVPLVHFTSARPKMGPFVNGWTVTIIACILALIITGLNAYLVVSSIINNEFGASTGV